MKKSDVVYQGAVSAGLFVVVYFIVCLIYLVIITGSC